MRTSDRAAQAHLSLGGRAQDADLRAGNEFIRDILRVVMKPVGRGRKVPVADRVEVNRLTPASASVPTPRDAEAVAS